MIGQSATSALNAQIQSYDALLVASLKASLADGSYTTSMDAAAVEELVYNYSVLLDFDAPEFPDEPRSSTEDLAEARAAMMEAVSEFDGVQVARAPCKRIQNLTEKAREYSPSPQREVPGVAATYILCEAVLTSPRKVSKIIEVFISAAASLTLAAL